MSTLTAGREFVVTAGWGRQFGQHVLPFPNGNFVVIWTDDNAGDDVYHFISGAIFNAQGQQVTGFGVANDGGYATSVALVDGGFAVTWTDAYGDGGSTRLFDIEGREVPGDIEDTGGVFPNYELADGTFVDLISEETARIIDAEGREVVGEFHISENFRPIGNASVTVLADGDFVVVWQTGRFNSVDLHARVFTFGDAYPPDAVDDFGHAWEDQAFEEDVLWNDTDPNLGDTLTIAEVNGEVDGVGQAVQGAWGTLVLNADGNYRYVADGDLTDALAAGEVREDIFTYSVADATGGTDVASLIVTVTAIADAETIDLGNGDDSYAAGPVWVDLDGDGAPDVQGDGDQTIHGGNGKDHISAGAGADKLYGDNGNDWLDGGAGMDTLCGGRGDDTLVGREGADTLVFEKGGGTDTVIGFEAGVDLILLQGITFRNARSIDLDGNGTTDTLLRFSNGAAELLDVDITALVEAEPELVFA